MNIEAAIAKALRNVACQCLAEISIEDETYVWLFFNRHALASAHPVRVLVKVTMTKMKGMIHSSFSFEGDRKNATLENKRAGVKRFILTTFSFY